MSSDGSTHSGPTVLLIGGSPRRRGNSEHLLDACARGVEAEGGQVVRLLVAEAGIEPCRGCNACSKTGECVLRDPMCEVYPVLDAADAIVISTPVFFATVPAVLKALYDRCQPYWARRHVLHLENPPQRPGALILVRGGGDPFGGEAAITPTRSVFGVLGVDCLDVLDVEGPDDRDDVLQMSAPLERAEQIGRTMVREVRSSAG